MSSLGRTVTPPPLSQVEGSAILSSTPAHANWSPHIFDFLFAMELDEVSRSRGIPSALLRETAVDSGVSIGSGASFTVTRQRLPAAPIEVPIPLAMDGITFRSNRRKQRYEYIVYKVARIAFTDNGRASKPYQRALTTVLTELHALIYPPLRRHKNIIDFIGIAWGSNPLHSEYRSPAIMVEYADLGTLAQFSEHIKPSDSLKLQLCADIANALVAIHSCGLVHGDLKPDNVLLCSLDRPTAKLSDFGYSVIAETASDLVMLGGTDPWKAPEATAPLPLADLRYTDVYSFGLIAWSIAVNRKDPFARTFNGSTVPTREDVQSMKLDGSLPALACAEARCLLAQRMAPELLQLQRSFSETRYDQDQCRELMKPVVSGVINEGLLGRLEQLLAIALQPQHRARDIDKISVMLNVTQSDSLVESLNTMSLSETRDWRRRGYKHHRLSSNAVRRLPPSLQTMVSTNFDLTDPGQLFLSAACHINGCGLDRDVGKGLMSLRQSAILGHPQARAYQYRIHVACGIRAVPGVDLTAFLFQSATLGARLALKDLQEAGPEWLYKKAWGILHNGMGGVGARWYGPEEMLHGLTQSALLAQNLLMKKVGTATREHVEIVNKRGDTLLHFAAACGHLEAVQALVEQKLVEVNVKNSHGETPLLCACRAGQARIAAAFVTRYKADATIVADSGESPLHWLISMQGDLQAFTEVLMRQGADIDACTNRSICHSAFPGTSDVDFRLPGTPLAWAAQNGRADIVRVLLKHGADAKFEYEPGATYTPITIAAHYHHAECLQIMIEVMEERYRDPSADMSHRGRNLVMYIPLHRVAIDAAETFPMMMRHGSNYLAALKSTLDVLRTQCEKTKTKMQHVFGGDNHTLLYWAVINGAEEVVKYMLDNDWHKDELDIACGDQQRTPFVEAVSYNKKSIAELFIQHGADIHHRARNPYDEKSYTWSALHAFAHEGHNMDLSLITRLLDLGVPVDGIAEDRLGGPDEVADHYKNETPFAIAVRCNSFRLAECLLKHGSNANALSCSSGLFAVTHPVSILGHIIVSNARYPAKRLHYLLSLTDDKDTPRVDFIVEPSRQLSALHLVALAYEGIISVVGQPVKRQDFDFDTNRDILLELLRYFNTPAQLNLPCQLGSKTALHLAVEMANVGVVQELIRQGANTEIVDVEGYTPVKRAEMLAQTSKMHEDLLQYF